MLLLFLTLLAFSAVTYIGVSRSLHGKFDRAFAEDVDRFIEESRLRKGELRLEFKALRHGELVAIYDKDGELLVQHDGPPPSGGPGIKEGFDGFIKDDVPWRRLTKFAPHLDRWLQVSRSQEDVARSLRSLFWFMAAGIPLIVSVAGAGGLFLASRLLNPLDKITRTAATLSAERLSERLPALKSQDELARLVQTFNQMLTRLDDAFVREKQFTSDAAHELRTPLARLLTRTEVTLSRPRTEAEYRAALEEIREGIVALSALLAKLLTIARGDAGRLQGDREPLDLAEVVEDTVQARLPFERDIRLVSKLSVAPVLGDQTRLTELVLNLLENAVRHSPDAATIEIEVASHEKFAVLKVKDHGPGVSPEARERIFERFYQAEESRHREGAGLGLAICRAIASQHNGEIELDKGYDSGACFVVRLPLGP